MRFAVTQVSVEPNIRGQAMRRVRLQAIAGEAFEAPALPEGQTPAEPDGAISLLVTPAFARRFSLGDEFDVMLRERG
jgi:hypothetical protein